MSKLCMAVCRAIQVGAGGFGVAGMSVLTLGIALAMGCSGRNESDKGRLQAQALTAAPSALLVVGDAVLSDSDALLSSRLEHLGLQVNVVDDDVVASSNATGHSLIVISESVLSAKVANKFAATTVPVLAMEVSVWDDMHLTGLGWQENYGDLPGEGSMVMGSLWHPLAAGLAGTVVAGGDGSKLMWGRPSASATVVATAPGDTSKAVIFGYEQGAAMVGAVAAGRRIGFFAGEHMAAGFTTEGWRLFDAAVIWARTEAQAPPSGVAEGALLVVADPNLNPADRVLRDRLVAMGHTVYVVDDDLCESADAAGRQVVVVSESVASGKVGEKFTHVAVPVVALEVAIWDDLRMTGAQWQSEIGDLSGEGRIAISQPAHPLADGLSGQVVVGTGANNKLMWGKPAASAHVVATTPSDPSRAVLFGYEQGAALLQGQAAGRRVGFFAGDPMPTGFTIAGARLFDAAVVWATRRAEALFVGHTLPLVPADELLKLRITQQGLGVHLVTGSGVQASHTVGKAVVVISETTESNTVGTRLRDVSSGVVSLEPALLDELQMTSTGWMVNQGVSFGQTAISVFPGGHPLSAGFTGNVAIASAPTKFIWGKPGPEAIAIAHLISTPVGATLPAASALSVFAYEQNALMVGMYAPARRVAWGAGDVAPLHLNANGWRLFQAAVSWAAGFDDSGCAGAPDGAVCDDGSVCTVGDVCRSGACVAEGGTLSCNDSNPCTADLCHPQNGCVYDTMVPEQQSWSCEIGGCGGGVCSAGSCLTGPDTNPMCNLEPTLACVYPITGGNYRAVFGYTNTTSPGTNLNVAPGSNNTTTFQRNFLSNGQVAANQPTWLEPGVHPAAFTVDLAPGASVTWTLGNKTRQAFGQTTAGCTTSTTTDGQTVVVGGMSYLVAPNPASIAAAAKVATANVGGLPPLEGKGGANPDGSYSYSIPIALPPGVNGMQPSLSLNYSSGAGNGLLGVGWSISGFSSITRCPKTKRVAGEVYPVSFSDIEQFCLDGNPLVFSTADGFYRTRNETFSKVVRNGSGTSTTWTVFSKDGRTLSYTATGALRKRQWADGTVDGEIAPGWWISSMEDRFGNRVEFEYTATNGPDAEQSAFTLERYPYKVRYTGPNFTREVLFKYVDRPEHDRIESYVMGLRYVTTKLLSAIETKVKNDSGIWSSVKEYRLAYYPNAANAGSDWAVTAGRKSTTGRSLLQSVTECEGAGAALCGPPTFFDWESGSWNFQRYSLNLNAGAILSFADIDEDGRDDIIVGDLIEDDICPPGGGLPKTTAGARTSFEKGCEFVRPDGNGPAGPNAFNTICDPLKSWSCPGLLISGTQLCDAYSRAYYAAYYPPGVSTSGCEVVDPPNKWARYSYILNQRHTAGGSWQPTLGQKKLLIDKYFAARATKSNQLRAPLVANLDHLGTPEVVTQEYERVEWNHHRYNMQVWPLGATNESQVLAYDSLYQFMEGTPTGFPLSLAMGDLDGDGLPELVYADGVETFQWRARFGNQVSSLGTVQYNYVQSVDRLEAEEAMLIDLNGDGRNEFLTVVGNGTAGSVSRPFPRALNRKPTFADFNGDGLPDALDRGTPANPAKYIVLNSGLRDARKIQLQGQAESYALYLNPDARNTDDGVRAGDFDGDGNTDVILFGAGFTHGTVSPVVLLKKGNSVRTAKLNTNTVANGGVSHVFPDQEAGHDHQGIVGWREVYVADFDGDGLVDIIQNEGTGGMALYRRLGGRPDMLKSVNKGLAAQSKTTVDYAPISDASSGVYTPVDCSAPQGVPCNKKDQINVSSGMWVVKRVIEDAGIASSETRSSRYEYFDGRRDRASGAFLGFRRFTMFDEQRASSKVTEFFMGSSNNGALTPAEVPGFGFVLAGQPRSETVIINGAHGNNVTSSSFEYEFVTFAGGITGMVRPYKTYQDVLDPRHTYQPGQSGCLSSTSEFVSTLTYVPAGSPGALTSEVASEVVVRRPGTSCIASADRVHATQTLTKTFTYWPENTSTWTVSLPKDVAETFNVNGVTTTKQQMTEWNMGQRVLTKSIAEPNGGPDQRSETIYAYNTRGLPETVTKKAAGYPDRFETTQYDSSGFPRLVQNQLGHHTEAVADPASGIVVWSRDMNGNITRKKIDGFFREVEVEVPNGSSNRLVTTTSYQAYGSAASPRLKVVSSQLVDSGGWPLSHLSYSESRTDRHGREVYSATRNANNQILKSVRKYDTYGRVTEEEVPVVTAPSLGFTKYEYDELDRVTKVITPDLKETITSRWDLVTTVMDPDGRVTQSVADTLGRVVKTRVVTGGSQYQGVQTFTYHPDGQLHTSQDSSGNTTTMVYDNLGRRTQLIDPDTGITITDYNAFGEVRLEETAMGIKTTFTRDVLGRTLTQSVVEPANSQTNTPARTRVTAYTWDTAPNGVGQAHTVVSYGGVVTAYGYDDLGRVVNEVVANGGRVHSLKRTYDASGRLAEVEYPEAFAGGGNGTPGTGQRTRVGYEYNLYNSSLQRVFNAASGATYWQAQSRDSHNHITSEWFGNGAETTRTWNNERGWITGISTNAGGVSLQNATYQYTDAGMLKTRQDTQALGGSLTETFQYDQLGRLRWWCVKDVAAGSHECGQSQFGVNYTFSDNGNLLGRKVFSWGNQGSPLENIQYTYSATTVRPHAVTQRAWLVGSGAGATFAYDNNGRQWQRPGQTIAYNHQDLPEKVVASNGTTTYLYDGGGSRYQKKTVLGANLTRTTTYVGALYEMREETGTAATDPRTHVFYIMAGDVTLAQISRREADLSDAEVEYLHNDHLGSVSFTTGQAGVASARVTHDPYGNRFNPTTAPRLDAGPMAGIGGVSRGYTGHEMEVDDLGVINMKGRIFDPVNGRFLSADPFVQAPEWSQSYNRYMYVMGNPMTFTDPTGYLGCVRIDGTCQGDPNETWNSGDFAEWSQGRRESNYQGSNLGTLHDAMNQAEDAAMWNQAQAEKRGLGFHENYAVEAMLTQVRWNNATQNSTAGGGAGVTSGGVSAGPLTPSQEELDRRTKGTILEGRVILDDDLNQKEGLLGHTSHDGKVRIDPKAFESDGVLKHVLVHEETHVMQIAQGRFHALNGSAESHVNEVEAHKRAYDLTVYLAPNDPALDSMITKNLGLMSDHIEKLSGTQYFEKVMRQVPADYSIDKTRTCPSTFCRLAP